MSGFCSKEQKEAWPLAGAKINLQCSCIIRACDGFSSLKPRLGLAAGQCPGDVSFRTRLQPS